MTFINGLLQRLLFTFGVMLFMQLPQFIDHTASNFPVITSPNKTNYNNFN